VQSTTRQSLANDHLRISIDTDGSGYTIAVSSDREWRRVGRGVFGRIATTDGTDARHETPIRLTNVEVAVDALHLTGSWTDGQGTDWRLEHTFALTDDPRQVRIVATATPSEDARVLHFSGPTILAGDGAFGARKTDGLFPGLEYLAEDEPSSSTAFASSAHASRIVPHPYKVTVPLMAVSHHGLAVGLMWDPNQAYGSAWRHPAAVFSSPNALDDGDNHLLGLFAPGVPFTPENEHQASRPFGVKPGNPITIEARLVLLAAATSIDVLKAWLDTYGLPALEPPQTYAENVDLCVRSYLDVAWDEAAEGWHHTLADPWGPRYESRVIAQLWRYSQWPQADPTLCARAVDQVERGLARALAADSSQPLPHLELALHRGQLAECLAGMHRQVDALVASQQPEGSWPWRPDLIAHPTFDTEDRRKAMGGEDSSTGLTAERGLSLLRWALLTGDETVGDAGLRAVAWCNEQTRPEGAQTWELHLHVPDVLAAPYLIDINIAAARLTGDRSYLAEAERWAWTGLPFTYLWRAYFRPIMAYGTVPVFGVTFHDVQSWFGVDVHWNGLVYADALFRLSESTGEERWRRIALGIVACGMQQQPHDGPWMGMYPDAMSMVRGDEEYTWWLNPNLIGLNTFKLAGIPLDVATTVVRDGERPVHVTSSATLREAHASAGRLVLTLGTPAGTVSHSIVAGIGKPGSVQVDSEALPEDDKLDDADRGWRWLPDLDLLLIKVTHEDHEPRVEIVVT
jgi:hypothetical protein